MHNGRNMVRSVLLGSAFALVALTPAVGADASSADLKRLRALQGTHVQAPRAGNASGAVVSKATYTILHRFSGGNQDGWGPGANVTLDDAGNIYGTTDYGTASGDGVVFELAPDGTETILHAFSGGADGSQPDEIGRAHV